MRPFEYIRVRDANEAIKIAKVAGQGQLDAQVQYLAGGTTLIDLMKLDVMRPSTVVDIMALSDQHGKIEVGASGLNLGAMAKMSEAAEHPGVTRDYPMIAESLTLAASTQLRNMATLAGNVLQRTRCPYYRDPSWTACNKRSPGSGCAALQGCNRNHAVLGVDDTCISQYPGDFAVALVALDAKVRLVGPDGERTIKIDALHRPPSKTPHIETTLKSGEIITGFQIAAGPWTRRSLYLKVRDRESYEFAVASSAVGLDMTGDTVRQARIALGGIAYRPWRAHEAEALLAGKPMTEANAESAAKAALNGAVTHGESDFKPELARRALVRALMQAATMEVRNG